MSFCIGDEWFGKKNNVNNINSMCFTVMLKVFSSTEQLYQTDIIQTILVLVYYYNINVFHTILSFVTATQPVLALTPV